ncbi:hypothetical protein [Streptomyces sp. DSM 40750]|uniref:hypothetical protein n=1 Tax=Streptomyces sp. DSM 40750 TaxID=2801030 RepID=UPI00214C4A73|nr:hypothetical protein [Streptomyces sp. DSM 40750]UUU19178.1 hypothetical protein JIX55_01900 [Streptomyces sp. DSM 40750]UUU27478.1 hypothetical protein JIX55_48845 [Streptomyces sp. DSM 40750]
MNNGNGGGLDARTALLLLVGGIGTNIAFLQPTFGVALIVGIGVMTILHFLLKH